MEMLVTLIVMVLVVGLLYWCITLLPIPEPFKKIVLVLLILLVVVWLLYAFLPSGALPHLYPRR